MSINTLSACEEKMKKADIELSFAQLKAPHRTAQNQEEIARNAQFYRSYLRIHLESDRDYYLPRYSRSLRNAVIETIFSSVIAAIAAPAMPNEFAKKMVVAVIGICSVLPAAFTMIDSSYHYYLTRRNIKRFEPYVARAQELQEAPGQNVCAQTQAILREAFAKVS